MARLVSSARPYPDATTAIQREANRAAAALRNCAEQRSHAAPFDAPAWLGTLFRARRRDGGMPCLSLFAPSRMERPRQPGPDLPLLPARRLPAGIEERNAEWSTAA